MGHAVSMRRITSVLSTVTCLAVPYVCTLSHERKDFLKKVRPTEYITRVLSFSTILSAKFLILGGTERDMIIYVHGSSLTLIVLMWRIG